MRPLLYQWHGGAMHPYGNMLKLAHEQFVENERYMLERTDQRSQQEHRQFFAWLNEAWANMPEVFEGRWTDPDRLRKWALCETGYCTVVTHKFPTRKAAERFMRECREQDDELFVERVRTKVIVRRPKSQSYAAMSKAEFRASKNAVVDFVSKLIGVPPELFRQEALAHA